MPYYLNSTKLGVAGGGGDPIGNVLGSYLTQEMLIVEATEQRHAPYVPALNKAVMRHIGAKAIVSGLVAASVVYAK